MLHHQSILVGVDGSRASSAAIRFGVHEAQRLGVPLRLVHVTAEFAPVAPMHPMLPADLEETGRAILAMAADEARALQPVQLSTSLISGPRSPALVRAAQDVRLIAFGHERHATFERLLTGATVTGVAAAAACPVVAVHRDWTPEGEHRRVLVGIKATADSSQLLRRAFEAAAERKAQLVVLHAWELPGAYDDMIAARVDLEEWEVRARHAIEQAAAAKIMRPSARYTGPVLANANA